MSTLALQCLVVVSIAIFAWVAVRVARQPGGLSGIQRAAWIVIAAAFLWRVVPTAVQSAAAVWAVAAGEGSRPYELFLRWTPAMNYGRTLIAVGVGWALAALPLLRGVPPARLWWGASAVAAALFGMGVYAGWGEGPTSAFHVGSLAILGAVELMGLLLALLVGLYFHTMDRYLWMLLCVYALHVTLNVVWYSATTNFFLPDGWYPSPELKQVYTLAVYLAGTGLAHRRLVLAQQGARVTGILDIPDESRYAAMGAGELPNR